MSRAHREKIQKTLKEFTGDALRVLALGMRTGVSNLKEEELIFIGLAGMADPVRPEAGLAVEEFRHAGVKTIMITGDRSDTAFAIAKELGIAERPEQCMTGEALQKMDKDTLLSLIHI